MRLRRGGVVSVWVVLGMLACASDPPGFPPLEVSHHFRTTKAAFEFDARSRHARYVLAYAVTVPFPEPVLLKVEFQNPINPNRPFRVERELDPGETHITVHSGTLPPLRRNGVYETVLTAHALHNDLELARHVQPVRFVRGTRL